MVWVMEDSQVKPQSRPSIKVAVSLELYLYNESASAARTVKVSTYRKWVSIMASDLFSRRKPDQLRMKWILL